MVIIRRQERRWLGGTEERGWKKGGIEGRKGGKEGRWEEGMEGGRVAMVNIPLSTLVSPSLPPSPHHYHHHHLLHNSSSSSSSSSYSFLNLSMILFSSLYLFTVLILFFTSIININSLFTSLPFLLCPLFSTSTAVSLYLILLFNYL